MLKTSVALEGFILDKSLSLSINTIAMYKWALATMLKQVGDTEVDQITPNILKKYWAFIKTGYVPRRMNGSTEPLTGRSLENIYTAIRSFFAWAKNEGYVSRRPDEDLPRPQYQSRNIAALKEEEIKRLLKAAEYKRPAKSNRRKSWTARRPTAVRDIAIILALLDTGVRVSELSRANVGDLDLEAMELHITPFGTGRKTDPRMGFLSQRSKKALWKYLADTRNGPENMSRYSSRPGMAGAWIATQSASCSTSLAEQPASRGVCTRIASVTPAQP